MRKTASSPEKIKRDKLLAERKRKFIKSIREEYNFPNSNILPLRRYGDNKNPTKSEILQGFLWGIFSIYIRLRDRGECISCGEYKKYEDLQAGHYVASGGSSNDLRFDPKNVNGECGQCNAFSADHLIPMRQNLIRKWGEEAVLDIEKRRSLSGKKWEYEDFVEKIRFYLKEVEKLNRK